MKKLPTMIKAIKNKAHSIELSSIGYRSIPVESVPESMIWTQPSVVDIAKRLIIAFTTLS